MVNRGDTADEGHAGCADFSHSIGHGVIAKIVPRANERSLRQGVAVVGPRQGEHQLIATVRVTTMRQASTRSTTVSGSGEDRVEWKYTQTSRRLISLGKRDDLQR